METRDECIYLDNAASTQLDEDALADMLPYMLSKYGNPSSNHFYGVETRIAIEQARRSIANSLGVKPQTIVFTSGGTEANNMAIVSAIRDLKCTHIITSKIEHHSVLNAISYYSNFFGVETSFVKLEKDGTIDYIDFQSVLNRKTEEGKKIFVSLMHANNEIGNITDIGKISELCNKSNAIFHTDCVQTIGHYPLNLSEFKMQFATASAHKFHGPKGIGLIYFDESIPVKALMLGGGQERNFRAGTENVAGIVGMAKALKLSYERFVEQENALMKLKQHLTSRLINSIPGAKINDSPTSLYSLLSVSFLKGQKSESLLTNLNLRGICTSGGSACSGNNSHVLEALGSFNNYSTIRFSFSRYNKMAEIDIVIDTLKDIFSVS